MAFQINDTTYAGTMASRFIMLATYGMDSVEKGAVRVESGIKKQHKIPRIDYKRPLKPRAAVPTTDNANPFTIDSRLLIPKDVDIYEEYNPRDLEQHELSEILSNTILDRGVPATLESQMIQLILNRAAESFETGIWQGSLQYAGNVTSQDDRYQIQYFNGFLQRMVNDPTINLSGVSPVTITENNIQTIMNDLIAQATSKRKALVSRKDAFKRLKFLMSPLTAAIYNQSLRGVTFKGNALDVGYIAPWAGYRVERIAGMPDNTILFCVATDDAESNLWVGVNSTADWDLKLARTAAANETFFVLGKMKWDVNYGWGEEIFLYTTLTPQDFIAIP